MHLAGVVALRLLHSDEKREVATVEVAPAQSVWDLQELIEVSTEAKSSVEPIPPPTTVARTVQAPVAERSASVQPPSSEQPANPDTALAVAPLAVSPLPPSTEPIARKLPGPTGLSLAELGIGGIAGANPFLSTPGAANWGLGAESPPVGMPAAFPKGAAYQAHARLQRTLAQGALQNDQELGLGPEGPVIAALSELTYEAADTPVNGEAQIRVVTNAKGQIVDVQLLSASGGTAAWERILRELLKRMDNQALRVAGHALTLDFQVKSREQLPSGRSPGLAVRAFGQNVKKGEGPNSSAIVILEPGLQDVPLYDSPDAPTIKVPTLVLLGINADPVDIGAAARRVVHVTLERLVVN